PAQGLALQELRRRQQIGAGRALEERLGGGERLVELSVASERLAIDQPHLGLLVTCELIDERLDQPDRAGVVASGQGVARVPYGARLIGWHVGQAGDRKGRQQGGGWFRRGGLA